VAVTVAIGCDCVPDTVVWLPPPLPLSLHTISVPISVSLSPSLPPSHCLYHLANCSAAVPASVPVCFLGLLLYGACMQLLQSNP
jgi:hypothetical protein